MATTSSETVESDKPYSTLLQQDVVKVNSQIVRRIIFKCKEEMENNCLSKPLEDYIGRAMNYTGLSKAVLNQYLSKNLLGVDYKDKHFPLYDRIKIFKFLAHSYNTKQGLTYKCVYTWYKTNNTKVTFNQFQYMMSCLGFDYFKTKLGKEILIEDPAFTFERYLYLKKINQLRSNSAPIYYIDERFFDSTFSFPKPWTKHIDVSSGSCDGYVFFHAVSKVGFLNGLFCAPTTRQDFIKWISHILIHQLPGPSVIVMDSNNLHGSVECTITKYNSKKEMLQYLIERGIPCNENMHRAELYELINKCSLIQDSYDVDDIFRAHGHQVLRLPSTFHDLSLTHFLWKYIYSERSKFINTDLHKLKIVFLEWLSNLQIQEWTSFHDNLIKTENDILDVDSKACVDLEANYNFR